MEKYLSAEEKLWSRDLWEEAFPEDSRSFDDYYYREKIKDNRILAACEDGRIQAMVQMNPYLIQAGNRRWRVDYLVGVATRKEKRHQGYMRRLLVRMMADMRDEEMPFCFLMPAAEAIYRPFGFTYIFRQPQWRLKEAAEKSLVHRSLLPAESLQKTGGLQGAGKAPEVGKRRYLGFLADWMNRWLEQRYQVYAVRDTEYLLRLMQELESENGTLDVLYDGDTMVGLQSIWGWEKPEQRLLYCEPPYVQETEEPKPAIMARIITPEQFVRAVRLQQQTPEEELTVKLELTDALIEKNQATWLWHFNHETSWMERVDGTEQEMPDVPGLCLDVTELTAWLFGYHIPEAAAPYADKIETLKPVFLDEVV